MDKARFLKLPVRYRTNSAIELLQRPETTTRAALSGYGFSQQMIDQFFVPFLAGIQLDPSLNTSSRMFDVIMQTLLRGDCAVPAAGMGAIPEQLAEGLADNTLWLNTAAAKVAPGEVTTSDGRCVRAPRVVVAVEGPAAAKLVDIDPVASNAATCVWLSAPSAPTPDRYVILDGTGGPAQNIAIMSNVAPTYAPPGKALIAAACPGVNDPDAESTVRAQLRTIWGPTVDSWTHLRTHAIAHGQPDQSVPFSPKQPVLLGAGLFVCGDHRDTASIQGALFSGRRAGEAVAASLTESQETHR